MKDQHEKIKGYRDLSQAEIDLMNQVKEKAIELEKLIDEVGSHINCQIIEAANADDGKMEEDRLDAAQPRRWASIARTHYQEGTMALIRSIAQPTTF